MVPEADIRIEIVYALPGEQRVFALSVPRGTTAREAIGFSGVAARYPELASEDLRLGIYGRVAPAETVLKDGDRVEIYRPLVADPKQARRARVLKKS